MQREMKLRCRVAPKNELGLWPCTAKMFDGTEFNVACREYDVLVQNEDVDTENPPSHCDGWILVLQEARQGDLVSITLPQPADVHGRRVNVSNLELMPRHVSVQNFNPSKPY